jgi:hypothetical protein
MAIQKLMARICPLSSQWKWEAIPHGDDAFLVSFPTTDDLKRVDGFQMGVPDSSAQMSVSIWKAQDVPHKFELQPIWVHVDGVPHTVRHFLGLWAVGSLIGTTLDVDLVSLRSRGVVRILVAMNEPKNLDKPNDILGYACLGVSVTVQLKGYDFFFRREPVDFVPDEGFTPFFWKRKGDDDAGFDGPGHDNPQNDAPNRDSSSTSASMDVDKPQGGNSSSHGKSVSQGPVVGSLAPMIAVTPINPNPTTPRGKEIVEALRMSIGFLAGDSPQRHGMQWAASPPSQSLFGAADMGRPSPLVDGHLDCLPVRDGPPHALAWAAPASPPLGSPRHGLVDVQTTPSVMPSLARAADGLLATPTGIAAGPLPAGGPSAEKEVAASLAAACAVGAAALLEAQGPGDSMTGGGSSTTSPPPVSSLLVDGSAMGWGSTSSPPPPASLASGSLMTPRSLPVEEPFLRDGGDAIRDAQLGSGC